jgi:predicted PurR-regulated permease PerM
MGNRRRGGAGVSYVVRLAVLFFLGVPGVILAVPVAASVKIVLEHYYSHPMRGRRRG